MTRFAGLALRPTAAGFAVMMALPISAGPVQAQLLDKLRSGVESGGQVGGVLGGGGGSNGAGALGGGGRSSGAGALGGLGGGLPSVAQAGPSNTAGVLQYCVRNNYVNGGTAGSLKNSLMSKVTGSGGSSADSGFQAGNKGVLDTGNGNSFSLGGGGLKAQATHKVCDLVLQHAKSLL